MNRIFHARVPWYTLFFLILLLMLTVWAYWERLGLVAMCSLLLMVCLIERTIHTTYTVTTNGQLRIHHGRFSKDIIIPLNEIRQIERLRSARFGNFCLKRYLLIHYGKDKFVSLIPDNEDELIKLLSTQLDKLN